MAQRKQSRPGRPRVPSRPDPRRAQNVNGAEQPARAASRRPPPPRQGEEPEAIAERRLKALELRKAGKTYREIAAVLDVGLATAYGDVAAELGEIRAETAHEAADVRELELQRCDAFLAALWCDIEKGDPRAIAAAIRIGERRARLLGLDAPSAQNVNVKGQVAVGTMTPDQARELIRYLTPEEQAVALEYQRIAKTVEERMAATLKEKG